MIVYGINPVIEALRAGRVKELRVGERDAARLRDVLKVAEREHVPIRRVASGDLDRAAKGGVHQGVVAELQPAQRYGVADVITGVTEPPLIVVLDGIEDPHNVG